MLTQVDDWNKQNNDDEQNKAESNNTNKLKMKK